MSSKVLRLCALLAISIVSYGNDGPKVNRKHSFRGPFQPGRIPDWHPSSTVHVGPPDVDRVKLTPFHGIKSGTVWNVIRSLMTDWEAFVVFNLNTVPDKTQEAGAGLAVWYASNPGIAGPVCGSADFWNGLGIFFRPSYPTVKVTAVINDETQQYMTWQRDQDPDLFGQIGECTKQFGSDGIFSALVKYKNDTLTMWLVPGVHSLPPPNVEYSHPLGAPCFTIQNAALGIDKYFGVTAYSVHKDDQYDIMSFTSTDYNPNPSKEFLEAARANYVQQQHDAHKKRYHMAPEPDKFRQQVMTILHQVQDTQEVLENSQEHLFTLMEHKLGVLYNQTGKIGQIQSIMGQLHHILRETRKHEQENDSESSDIAAKRLIQRVQSAVMKIDDLASAVDTSSSKGGTVATSQIDNVRWLQFGVGSVMCLFVVVFILVAKGFIGWASKDQRKYQ